MCITKRDSIYNNPNCMISFFLEWGDGVWTQDFVLAKQALYHLNPTSSPFCFGYFWRWGLVNCLFGLASNHDPPNLSLPSI
jgi:hypothetical protein